MKELLTFGQMLAVHARLHADRVGARDLERAMTFREWNDRSCRLANALLGLGLRKGDRVAVLAYNRVEWVEIYAAAAKAGLIVVPINFRLVGPEIRYVVENAEAGALIVEDALLGAVEEVRGDLPVPAGRLVHLGGPCPAGWRAYEELIAVASDREPGVPVAAADPWTLMYTSGTTGKPKGVVRSHKAAVLLSLVTEIELGLHREDSALLVMPMCHANSLNFFGAFAYCGAETAVYSRRSFDPEHCVRTLAERRVDVHVAGADPLHHDAGPAGRGAARRTTSRGVTKLMVSSAPARQDTKRAVMAMFRNSGLFELYGSSEAGWVTMLRPHEQFTKLGSVGRECVGSAPVRLLDPEGNEVPDGEAGELYSSQPLHLRRLLEAAGEDEGGVPRRLLHGGRHGPAGRGRLHPPRRPQEQHDHLGRRERLPVRGRGGAGRASGGQGRGGGRPARRDVGRAGARGGRAARRRDA